MPVLMKNPSDSGTFTHKGIIYVARPFSVTEMGSRNDHNEPVCMGLWQWPFLTGPIAAGWMIQWDRSVTGQRQFVDRDDLVNGIFGQYQEFAADGTTVKHHFS